VTHVTARMPNQAGPTPRPGSRLSTSDTEQTARAAGKPSTAEPGYRRVVTYADSGVSVHARPEAVEVVKKRMERTWRPEVVGDANGFAAMFRIDPTRYQKPLLTSSTDGVGPKLGIAQQLDIHDTVGTDLVAMVVDDLVACGAEPLFLQYYLSCGEVVPDRVAAVTAGIADASRVARCSLLGGETAEHPGVLRAHEYDLSGTGVGVVDEDDLLGAHRVEVGDVVVAMGSSGLHANGFSLVQHALLGIARMRLDTVIDEFENQRTLGEELLTPTRIYARDCLDLMVEADVRAFAHVTGGGITGNLARVLPEHADAVVDRATWRPQPIFDLVQRKGHIEEAEMESTFNMGIGMLAVVPVQDSERTVAFLRTRGVDAWVAGEIVDGTGGVTMVGSHTRG
jgi:phosphoribosylformylglycinamidine cyclo-ligase